MLGSPNSEVRGTKKDSPFGESSWSYRTRLPAPAHFDQHPDDAGGRADGREEGDD